MTHSSASSSTRWNNVADWSYLVLGVLMLICGIFLDNTDTWASSIAGVVMAGVALWDLAAPSIAATWAEGIVAFVVFLLPWFSTWLPGDYNGPGSWLTWAGGVLGMVCAAWSWASHTDPR